MTIHHARFLEAVTPPVRALPEYLFDQQRQRCNACDSLIASKRHGMRCAAVVQHEPGYMHARPIYCLDVHTRGQCPERGPARPPVPQPRVSATPARVPKRAARPIRCAGCHNEVPAVGNTIRRISGVRRRVGACCARVAS
ncbi:MAG TPA: hypothetical protein VNU71_13405 [Burkholderiaceae bacterium]|nr:hypothetical protein [Burkholderiaceae bacterium]